MFSLEGLLGIVFDFIASHLLTNIFAKPLLLSLRNDEHPMIFYAKQDGTKSLWFVSAIWWNSNIHTLIYPLVLNLCMIKSKD